VQVAGRGSHTYTFTDIALGSGLSLSLVSLVLRNKRPASEYVQQRLAEFFGITIEQLRTPGTLTAHVPPVRRLVRIGRVRPRSRYRRIGRVRDVSQVLEGLEPELGRPWTRAQLEDSDGQQPRDPLTPDNSRERNGDSETR
jgi:transcriptional regulator with XRE-family HTH domain